MSLAPAPGATPAPGLDASPFRVPDPRPRSAIPDPQSPIRDLLPTYQRLRRLAVARCYCGATASQPCCHCSTSPSPPRYSYSPLTSYSLLATCYPLLTTRYSLVTTYYPLLDLAPALALVPLPLSHSPRPRSRSRHATDPGALPACGIGGGVTQTPGVAHLLPACGDWGLLSVCHLALPIRLQEIQSREIVSRLHLTRLRQVLCSPVGPPPCLPISLTGGEPRALPTAPPRSVRPALAPRCVPLLRRRRLTALRAAAAALPPRHRAAAALPRCAATPSPLRRRPLAVALLLRCRAVCCVAAAAASPPHRRRAAAASPRSQPASRPSPYLLRRGAQRSLD